MKRCAVVAGLVLMLSALSILAGCSVSAVSDTAPATAPALAPATAPPVAPTYDPSKLADAMEQEWGKAGSYTKPPRAAVWFPSGATYAVTEGKVVVSTPWYPKASNRDSAMMLATSTATTASDVYGFSPVHVQVLAKNGDLLASATR